MKKSEREEIGRPAVRLPFKVVIPARYASTRLPAKPLLDLGGKPMVVRVAERALLSGADEVVVATDHAEVLAVARQHGVHALLTHAGHASGTDRWPKSSTYAAGVTRPSWSMCRVTSR